jgi:two-component system alkaline phosphatase synthesis response regulator PhoP
LAGETRAQAPRILVVDDDKALSMMVSLVLKQSEFDVDVVNNGDDAIRRATERAFDAVVLDLRMPGKDGRAVFRELRELGVTTPVLILSAYDARQAQAELGAEGSMNKPFEPDVLVDVLKRMISRS